jgi:hypothetical protein
LEQSAKAPLPIAVTDEGIAILVRFIQAKNAYDPIVVTDEGMVIFVKPQQLLNAEVSMLVTDEGIVTLVNSRQEPKAHTPMTVTGKPSIDAGIVTLVSYPIYFVILIERPSITSYKSPSGNGASCVHAGIVRNRAKIKNKTVFPLAYCIMF